MRPFGNDTATKPVGTYPTTMYPWLAISSRTDEYSVGNIQLPGPNRSNGKGCDDLAIGLRSRANTLTERRTPEVSFIEGSDERPNIVPSKPSDSRGTHAEGSHSAGGVVVLGSDGY